MDCNKKTLIFIKLMKTKKGRQFLMCKEHEWKRNEIVKETPKDLLDKKMHEFMSYWCINSRTTDANEHQINVQLPHEHVGHPKQQIDDSNRVNTE